MKLTLKMKLAFAFAFCLMAISAPAQNTGSSRISATIVAPDNICALSLNAPGGNIFTLVNGQDNCFDITLGSPDPLMPFGKTITQNHQSLNYSLTPPPSTNDIRVTIAQSNPSSAPQKNTPFTLCIHYN